MTVIEQPPLASRLRPWLSGFDIPLLLAVLWICLLYTSPSPRD